MNYFIIRQNGKFIRKTIEIFFGRLQFLFSDGVSIKLSMELIFHNNSLTPRTTNIN